MIRIFAIYFLLASFNSYSQPDGYYLNKNWYKGNPIKVVSQGYYAEPVPSDSTSLYYKSEPRAQIDLYDSLGQIYSHQWRYADGSRGWNFTFQYDELGNRIVYKYFDENDSVTSHVHVKYDAENREIAEIGLEENGDTSSLASTIYSEDKLSTTHSFEVFGTETYYRKESTFSEDRKFEREIHFDKAGDTTGIRITHYDLKGNILMDSTEYPYNIGRTYFYERDTAGRILSLHSRDKYGYWKGHSENSYFPDGKLKSCEYWNDYDLVFREKYYYDDHGFLVKTERRSYEYEGVIFGPHQERPVAKEVLMLTNIIVDIYGNWTRKETYRNGKIYKLQTREFEYYGMSEP